MKKHISLIILLTWSLTACQLPNPTAYTPQSLATASSSIDEIKQMYQYNIVNEQQQIKLDNLEREIKNIQVSSMNDKQEKLMRLQEQYLNVCESIQQQNIDEFTKLIEALSKVDIMKLPKESRQQYIVSGEKIANFLQFKKFNKSMTELKIIKNINETYHLDIANELLR